MGRVTGRAAAILLLCTTSAAWAERCPRWGGVLRISQLQGLRLRGGAAEAGVTTSLSGGRSGKLLEGFDREAFDTVMKRRFFFAPSFQIHGGGERTPRTLPCRISSPRDPVIAHPRSNKNAPRQE